MDMDVGLRAMCVSERACLCARRCYPGIDLESVQGLDRESANDAGNAKMMHTKKADFDAIIKQNHEEQMRNHQQLSAALATESTKSDALGKRMETLEKLLTEVLQAQRAAVPPSPPVVTVARSNSFRMDGTLNVASKEKPPVSPERRRKSRRDRDHRQRTSSTGTAAVENGDSMCA